MDIVSSTKCFGGDQQVWRHASKHLGVDMNVGVFVPPQAATQPCPVLVYLSGLTCTEQNVVTKGGFQQSCAERGVILVCPDTSPRGEGVPDDDGYDLGQGAGFYLDATKAPWAEHFKMESYVLDEVLPLVAEHAHTTGRIGITGHSMGGHGALVLALRHPGVFHSVSAFAPIVAPSQVPWGEKAFTAYLGDDRAAWQKHDAVHLVADAKERLPLLVDQGLADNFLDEQLRPHLLQEACDAAQHPLTLRTHEGYDHGYHFVATFAADHVAHHATQLTSTS